MNESGSTEERLRDLSEQDLPEVGPKTKVFPDVIVVYRRRDGRYDWHRLNQTNGEIAYGSNQGYEEKSYTIERARLYHPDLTVDLSLVEEGD